MPHRAPSTRYAFVAPMFRLPTVRRSTPRARPIQSQEGSPPSRNPIRTEVRRSGIGASVRRPVRSPSLLASLPVQHDRNALEAEPLPQTTLQVTYIILDSISRIVHIKSEGRRLDRGLGRVIELEVLSRRGRRRHDPVQDVLDRPVQLGRGDLP